MSILGTVWPETFTLQSCPCRLRPVTIKPVGRIFEISDSNPIRGKGSEETPQSKKAENAESAENVENVNVEMQKKRLTGFNVTAFR